MSDARRWLFLLIFGGGGLAVLLSLGFWQLDRLTWKQGVNAEIAARGTGAPVAITGEETAERDDHRAASAEGRFLQEPGQLRYLTSVKGVGPGFRLIAAFELNSGARILVDRGFAPEKIAPRGASAPAPPSGPTTLLGVLRWPEETSRFTPAPNLADQLWFARDVGEMAKMLGARPVMLVHAPDPDATIPIPVGADMRWPAPVFEKTELPNNHLGYAITWFSLAAIWLAMSTLWVLRTRS